MKLVLILIIIICVPITAASWLAYDSDCKDAYNKGAYDGYVQGLKDGREAAERERKEE